MSVKTTAGEYHCRFISICIYPEKLIKHVFILVVVLSSCTISKPGISQTLHTNSNRAVKAYSNGLQAYDFRNLPEAESLFKEAIQADQKFFEAYMMLGELYTKQNRFEEASASFRAALQIDSTSYKPLFFSLASAEMMTGDYINALSHFKSYLRQKGMSGKNIAIAGKNILNCEFAINAMKNPVEFEPVNIGSSINTTDDEYWPSITADGQTFMFTRQVYSNSFPAAMGSSQEDFYLSYIGENGWQKAINAGEPLNTKQNEGAQTLSSNGKYMYFTACEKPGGLGSCDLYFSAYINGKWSLPYNLGAPVNTSSWESTPSINADGNLLIFSSSRPGGFGGKDLWYSLTNSSGKWSKPVNIGETLNTDGDEMSPFIHFDGRTLYYASDGRTGMGGFDIYMTRMNTDSSWSEPVNLGYPINTFNDETGLVIESGGNRAYFSSKRDNYHGKDIFYFELNESIRPDPVSYLKGNVTDKETGKLLKAEYELINLSTNKITVKSSTDEQGNFLVCLPSGFNYGINVTKPGYLFYSDNFMFEGEHSSVKPMVKRISLSPAKVGEKMLLTNVFYEIDSWELRKESREELNNLADLLSYNMKLIVEIGGYTDSTGTDEHNLVLSEKRANSVVDYLVGKGISSSRLKPKGYGNSFPVGDNETQEGRRLNRRTEAKIIGQ